MERLELVSFNRCFIFMQMCKGILCTVMVGIVVGINRLCFKASNRVKFLDCRCAKACESPEDSSLDLCHLCVLHRIDEGVLRLCSMVLQLLRCVLLPEGRNLVEIPC